MIASNKSHILSKVIVHTILAIVSLLCIIPLVTVVTISVTGNDYLLANGYSILPKQLDFQAYKYIFKYPSGLIRAYSNSFVVTAVGCILSLIVSSMFAYAVSRKDYRFRNGFTLYVVFTMLFNGGMVANYIIVTNYYHLQDNLWAMILPYLVVPMHVLILKSFFAAVPMSIIESAKIDGANEFYTFYRIVVPLSKPAIAAVGLLILLTYWNDWWLGLLYINDSTKQTIQLMLNSMMQNIEFLRSTVLGGSSISLSNFPSESARMAMCVLAAGPMLIVFPFFQKYFVKGLTVGSVKG